nr:hypothetical protein CFP56_26582 [Quercus suber]
MFSCIKLLASSAEFKISLSSVSRIDRGSTKSTAMFSSLQELFEGFNLGDENLVEIFCETSPDNSFDSCPNIKWIGVHVQCICHQPQKSSIFHDNYCIQPRGRRISKRNVHRRLRPSLLKGPNFILRRLYNTQYRSTLWPTPCTSLQPLLKATKISNKNRPLVARSRKCLCGAQTRCRCPKEVGNTYSAGPVSVHSSNLESRILSSAMNGGGSSLVSNSGLSMDVKNGSDLGLELDSSIGFLYQDFNNEDPNLMIASVGGYNQVVQDIGCMVLASFFRDGEVAGVACQLLWSNHRY